MTHFQSTKTLKSKRFLAFLLTLSFLSSALPFIWFCRVIRAAEPIPETGNHVFHDNEYFELYHTVNGEPVSKKLEYLFAETVKAGEMRPVYCVRAGSPTPENGSIQSAAMQDPAAASLLGKIQYIIEMDESLFQLPDTVNSHPHIHYYVRQILIWHLVHLYRDGLGSSVRDLFTGIDINSFVDGEGSGPTAVKILTEAKRLWNWYDQAGRPSKAGAYVPNYQATIQNASGLTYDTTSHLYRATFSVTVNETVRGNAGGTFKFTDISGGTVYLTDASGKITRAVSKGETLSSGSTFQIQGQWGNLTAKNDARGMSVGVTAVSNGSNTRSQLMYGYFFDNSLTASGLPRQTYVGWHESSVKTYASTSSNWTEKVWTVDLTKQAVFQDLVVPEAGAGFEIYPSDFSNYNQASAAGMGYRCISSASGKIVDATTGEVLKLPQGNYTIQQTTIPQGTCAMSPNPSTFTVVAGSGAKNTYKDEMKAGFFAISKKIQTGYDVYAGTAVEELAPEADAKFQVWCTTYDSYDAAPNAYRDLLTTDADGYTRSKVLPYGDYKVHQIESEATKYTYACADTTVSIRGMDSASNSNAPEQTLTLVDRQYELKIQIRKVDERTGEIVPAAGVKFQVLDQDQHVLMDWDGCDTFETSEDGTANLEKLGLRVGTYYIREVEAPRGFVISEEQVPVEVKKDETFIGVGPQGDLKAVDFADEEVDVSVTLLKTGEVLVDAEQVELPTELVHAGTTDELDNLTGYAFVYAEQPLAGATYELYCEEDVLDFERDIALLDPAKYPEGSVVISEDGTTFAPYKCFDADGDDAAETPLRAGTLLGTYTTDEEGRIIVEGLSLDAEDAAATYKMIEISAPDGYLVDAEPVIFEVTDDRADQTITVVSATQNVTDARQQAVVCAQKQASDWVFDEATGAYVTEEKALGQAVLGVFAAEPILSEAGEVLVENDELIEVMVSDATGECASQADYPLGASLYIQEIQAPEGYVLNTSRYPVTTTSDPEDMTTETFFFQPAKALVNVQSRAGLVIQKTAADTGMPMANVAFEVYTEDGHLLETLVTDETGFAQTTGVFAYGEEIILRETRTDERYALGADEMVQIVTAQTDEAVFPMQTVTLVNYPLSEIRIEKHCGDGSRTPMDGVTFQLWAVGNGDAPDQLVAEEETDAEGFVRFYTGAGEYYVVESDVGSWTRFRVMDAPIPVTCGQEGKLFYYEVVDAPTETVTEKRAAGTGELLGHCGISVRDSAGRLCDFVWHEETGGYVACEPGTEGATQILYTGNDPNAPQFGIVTILGLEAGDYEIFEVEAPEGYRNDSESMPVTVENRQVLGATRLYDTVKTSETDILLGIGCCSFFGISSASLMGVAVLEFAKILRRKKQSCN